MNYSVSRRGDLVYVPGGGAIRPAGGAHADVGQPARARKPRLPLRRAPTQSPGCHQTARASRSTSATRPIDIAIWDLAPADAEPVEPSRGAGHEPDVDARRQTRHLDITRGGGNPNLYWQAADGTGDAERLTVSATNQFPTSTTPDGSTVLVFGASGDAEQRDRPVHARHEGSAHTPEPLIAAAGMDIRRRSVTGRKMAGISLERFRRVPGLRASISECAGRPLADFDRGRYSRGVVEKRARALLSRSRRSAHVGRRSDGVWRHVYAGPPVKILSTKILCRRVHCWDSIFAATTFRPTANDS